METDADVAFIKKETVLENTDGNNQDSWASGLRSEDFEILCKDGTRRAITEDADCHLAPVRTISNHLIFISDLIVEANICVHQLRLSE